MITFFNIFFCLFFLVNSLSLKLENLNRYLSLCIKLLEFYMCFQDSNVLEFLNSLNYSFLCIPGSVGIDKVDVERSMEYGKITDFEKNGGDAMFKGFEIGTFE